MDPPVGTEFNIGSGTSRRPCTLRNGLYRGGYIEFSPRTKSTLDFDHATAGLKRISALGDLCYYYTKSDLIRETDFSSPAAATVILKRYVASHWMVLLQNSSDLLRKYEYAYHRASNSTNLRSSSIQNSLHDAQYLQDRIATWCDQLDRSIMQFKASGTLGNFPGQSRINKEDEDDFIDILRQFHQLKQKVQTVISSMVGLLSIVVS